MSCGPRTGPPISGKHVRFCRSLVLSQAFAETASAHLDRRRKPRRAASRRQARRCLVSRQQQPDSPARYAAASCRRIAAVQAQCERRRARSRPARRLPARAKPVRLACAQDPGRQCAAAIYRRFGRHGRRCASLSAIGVGHVAVGLGGQSIEDAVERIERFGAEVIAKLA